jgi:hypothetical protein
MAIPVRGGTAWDSLAPEEPLASLDVRALFESVPDLLKELERKTDEAHEW